MKAHGSSLPLRVKDSSVAAGILENVCGSGEESFVGREKGLAGFEALVGEAGGWWGDWRSFREFSLAFMRRGHLIKFLK